jgi:hypothetical protein
MRHVTRGLAGFLAAILSLALVLPVAATEPPSTAGALACDLKVTSLDPDGVESAPQDATVQLEQFQNFNVYGTGFAPDTTIYLRFDMPNVAGFRLFAIHLDGAGAFVEQFFAYPVYADQPQPNLWQLSVSNPLDCPDSLQIQVWNFRGTPYFTDTIGHLFEHHISWLFMNGIAKGCGQNFYCPEAVVTREQMASFLVRALSLPATATDFFTDDETSVHEADINRLAASGVTTGCTATLFCPTQAVTRQEMASFLVRALDLPATSTDNFTDDESSVHEADINALAASGITTGCAATRFCPTAGVTRGQMAAFLMRANHGPYILGTYGPQKR